MRSMETAWVSNWTTCLCTAASTTWLSLPRNTSEKHRGTGGQTHMCSVKNKKELEGFSVKLKFALTVINK